MQEKDYLNEFLMAVCGSNNLLAARTALLQGLNKQEGFTFDNPRLWFAVHGARDIQFPLLMIEFGFDKKKMLNFALEHKETILADKIVEMLIKEEKDELGIVIKNNNSNKDIVHKV